MCVNQYNCVFMCVHDFPFGFRCARGRRIFKLSVSIIATLALRTAPFYCSVVVHVGAGSALYMCCTCMELYVGDGDISLFVCVHLCVFLRISLFCPLRVPICACACAALYE